MLRRMEPNFQQLRVLQPEDRVKIPWKWKHLDFSFVEARIMASFVSTNRLKQADASNAAAPFLQARISRGLKDCALRVLWQQFQSSPKGGARYQLKKQQFLARNYGSGLRKLHEMAKGELNA